MVSLCPSASTEKHEGRVFTPLRTGGQTVKGIFAYIGMSLGGWIGWFAGAWISIFTAFILSMIGTGVGLYAAHRIARQLLP